MSEFRRRLTMQVESDLNAIPAGCVRCEYLESTGIQWIDTEMLVHNTDIVRIDFMSFEKSPYCAMYGWRWQGTYSEPYECIIQQGEKKTVLFIGKPSSPLVNYIAANVYIQVVINFNEGYTTVNGEFIKDADYSTPFDSNGTSKLYPLIFNFFNVTQVYPTCANGRVYCYNIINSDGIIIQNLIPILDQEGVPCMYDTVNKKFHYNKGTGQFLYKILEQ